MLVVDDERAWRVILETDLRMLGYKVSMAEDADQALEKAQSDQPEVAIIDLMLPEPMDGWGLLNELRARGQKVPVIFYTAYPVFPSGTDDPDVVGYKSKAIDRGGICTPSYRPRSGARASAETPTPRWLPTEEPAEPPSIDPVRARCEGQGADDRQCKGHLLDFDSPSHPHVTPLNFQLMPGPDESMPRPIRTSLFACCQLLLKIMYFYPWETQE